MRLLRLVSDVPSGPVGISEFENYFNDNIIIKAGGKIGLLNASIPINYKEVHITQDNNQLQFKTSSGYAYHDINLGGNNVYSIHEFLTLLKTKCYQALEMANNYDIGFTINFALVNKKVTISTFRARYNRISSLDAITYIPNTITIGNDVLTRSDPALTDNTAFLYSRVPALLSCSFFRVQITTLGNMILGLAPLLNPSAVGVLNDNNFKYAMKIDKVGATYYYYYYDLNGALVQVDLATATPTRNDWLGIEIEQGQIHYRIYQGAAADVIEVASYEINQLESLHFAIGLRETNIATNLPRVYYEPFFSVNTLNDTNEVYHQNKDYSVYEVFDESLPESVGLGINPGNPILVFGDKVFTLNFPQEGLRNILGFTTNTLNYAGQSTMFVSPTEYNALSVPSTLLIEIPTIKLNSFDGLTRGRRNIVAIVPNQITTSNERLLYSVANPIMLDIDNQFDMNLRSIRARITSGDDEGSLLEVFDRIELTFLID